MNDNLVNHLLEQPWLYHLSQLLMAPGADRAIKQRFRRLLAQLPPARRVLDVGCGPLSRLWQVGLQPVGLDLSFIYTVAYRKAGSEPAVTGSAALLPFANGSFGGVWSIGLLHHLPNGVARQAVGEMLRVCYSGGYVVIFDAVLPEPAWQRPIAHLARRMDRGKFMRREETLVKDILLPDDFVVERFTYTLNGLEAILAYAVCE